MPFVGNDLPGVYGAGAVQTLVPMLVVQDRAGRFVASGSVEGVREPAKDRTMVLSVIVPKALVGEIRGIEVNDKP